MSTPVVMLVAITVVFFTSLILNWICLKIAVQFGWIDIPLSEPHKRHRQATPIAGGLGLILALFIFVFGTGLWRIPEVRTLLLVTGVIFATGLWDDIWGLPVVMKLLAQLLASMILIASGDSIRMFQTADFVLGGQGPVFVLADYILTIAWVVALINAINFIDSADGLAAGLGCSTFLFFVVTAHTFSPAYLQELSGILLGICLGLFIYNVRPARFFLGDSGSQTLGIILASLSILYRPLNAYQNSSWAVPILILGVPLFDLSLVVFSRLRRRVPIYRPGLDHTYHRLVKLGNSPNKSVVIMIGASCVLDIVAFIILRLPPLWVVPIFGTIMALWIAGVILLDRPEITKTTP
jgi:UDP-GlcNAc:undecaprenyl-phosphate/decaprenyl-phosphate GlcNAc-1-phosphate transferase